MEGLEEFDVAVVGGGPGGACAAREAAKNKDLDVVVFEKGVRRTDRESLGPDSTDAAGFLDYWLEIMDIPKDEFAEIPILQEINDAEFIGPSEKFVINDTRMDSWYDKLGFTFDRARMDDLLVEKAKEEGAEYRVGKGVKRVSSEVKNGGHRHEIEVAGDGNVEAEYLILADGPQRRVTIPTLEQFEPEPNYVSSRIGPKNANHIAYQEYRRFPDPEFDEDTLKFWWGVIPGETAYPWYFPNEDNIVKMGLTMPIDLDISKLENPPEYALLREGDDRVPSGSVYIRRLMEDIYGDDYDVEEDFPLVESKGKNSGTESYPISSTRPIDSPTKAGVAVVGGAMGTTSAFHEGGYHLASRTGKIAGSLAAEGRIDEYNDEWKEAVGDEILRNVSIAEIVRDYRPSDWDTTFEHLANSMGQGGPSILDRIRSGIYLYRMRNRYKEVKEKYRTNYAQIKESDYKFS
ncbi:MAG: NAD(P)/FAD-dependent oxidoreductase [Halobacteria archaeon]|nr:NAD(P)/FAD-dependent oxidoreductase [Halobacteria archaeon]